MRSLAICIMLCISFAASSQSFTGKPRYNILTKRNGDTLGNIQVELWPNIAPKHVRNFDSLVSVSFYDSCAFHRVVPGFVIQGGDPNSRHGAVNTWGYGAPWQPTVPAEFSVAKHLRGVFSAARLGNDINSATSQFFICVAPAANLNGNYTAYGKVTSGMTVVDTIVNQPTVGSTQRPVQKIEMFIMAIGSNDTVPAAPSPITPSMIATAVDTTFISFKWTAVSDAVFYTFHLSSDSLFSDTLLRTDLTGTSITKNSSIPLAGNTWYYWKSTVNNGGHYSPETVWRFHTAGQTTGLAAIKSETFHVFPNPGFGVFRFNGVESNSALEVTDLRGRVVKRVTGLSGNCEVDLKDLGKGSYQYRLTSAANVHTGRLVID